eukprot:TRINITY_DN18346_c0_g1_i1.p1 TRINITY_DN18346_c0_g1~~TRINITY_DN18346_c0_g1_i1.p1  ORF type:complete len:136 (-),score=38.00 TRINITY_DN18346_c0_g1_i1:27-434(-)
MAQPQLNQNQIIAMFKQMRAEQNSIVSRMNEVEVETNEHNLVLLAMDKLEGSRKCYRLVGGVLVERTVAEVAPAVQRNRDGLLEVTKSMEAQLQQKGKEINDFVVKYNIKIQGQNDKDEEDKPQKKTTASSGVLV